MGSMEEQGKTPNHRPNGKFAPGNNANPNGRPKDGESWSGLMAEIGNRTGATGKALKEMVLEAVYSKALGGDLRAAELILDRIEGKAIAKVEQEFKDVTPGARISFRKGNVTELPLPEDNGEGKATG
jgi:hypothetical protein